MTYDLDKQSVNSSSDLSSFTVAGTVSGNLTRSSGHVGATANDAYSDAMSHSFTRTDNYTGGTTNTKYNSSTYTLHEAGTYSGESSASTRCG